MSTSELHAAPSATSEAEIARVEAVWGDPDAWVADGVHWTSLPEVHRMLNRRVTGDPEKSPLAWFLERVAAERPLPVDRALVLACGGGDLERQLMRMGCVREIVAIDLSERVLDVARDRARAEGVTGITYRRGDMNDLVLDEAPFDIVFGVSAIHHCAALERLFAAAASLLKPDGWFYLDDFVGPSRFQWTDEQLTLTNRMLALLPDGLVRTRSGVLRREFHRYPLAEVIAFDPSEAVRSAEIPEQVYRHFDVEEHRGYGGALLHLVLGSTAQNYVEGSAGEPYLHRLIEAEEHLMQVGRLPDDFTVMMARPRRQ